MERRDVEKIHLAAKYCTVKRSNLFSCLRNTL